MKISSKLKIIVLLTVFEISLTLWSLFEIAKGAEFHKINSLHLKYSAEFSKQVSELEQGLAIDIPLLKANINDIRQQPVTCIELANALDRFIMHQIGTAHALALCEKDIRDADKALDSLHEYLLGNLDRASLVAKFKVYAIAFNQNSVLFEKPISQTVSFIMSAMIPLVIFISLFNILLISLMSRNITGSINGVINLLEKTDNKEKLENDISQNVSGEIKTLLEVARRRLTNEIMIKEVNQKLEYLVEQRTSSLTKANEELAQFAYRASHDLKAPLTSTKRLAEFIKQDIQAGELQNAIEDSEKIVSQMATLEELVIDILALTEVDSIEQKFVEIDFELIMSDIRQSHLGLFSEYGCIIESEVSLTQPMKAQKARVTQILENLVTNAVKYSDQSKQQPFVKIKVIEVHDCYVLTVEDNGLGIPEARQGEVFQMFKRFHPNVSFGSGLGLAIVKKHVDYMQGTIDVQNTDVGSKFSITFPKENLA